MTSFTYLLSKKIKNRIKLALTRPTEIIFGVLLVMVFVSSFFINGGFEYALAYRSIDELYAIIFLFYSFAFIMNVNNGFENGATMFTMADVNLIFTSPKKPQRVLLYGLLSQSGKSVSVALFVLYQYTLLHDTYGVDFKFVIAILIGYALTVLCSQMLAMIIYSLTSKSDFAVKTAKILFYFVVSFFAFRLVLGIFSSPDKITAAVKTLNLNLYNFFPVSGFIKMGVVSYHNANTKQLLLSLAILFVLVLLYIVVNTFINADYYEDVLKSTEISFSAITSRKEGRVKDAVPKKIKIGKTGFEYGYGAMAIYEKHKIENRRSKHLLLSTGNIVMAVITIVFAYALKNQYAAYAFNLYVTLFSVAGGRWAKELRLPYVYLIPQKSFYKLINMLKEQLPSLILESIVTFLPIGIIFGFFFSEVLAFCLGKIGFSLICIGVNLLFQRFLGNGGNKAFIVFLYLFAVLLFSLPYIIIIAVFTALASLPLDYAMLFASFANFAVAIFLIFLSRNVLSVSENNNK